MKLGRLLLVCALALGVTSVAPAITGDSVADAKTRTQGKKKGKGKGKKTKLCEVRGTGKKAKRRC